MIILSNTLHKLIICDKISFMVEEVSALVVVYVWFYLELWSLYFLLFVY